MSESNTALLDAPPVDESDGDTPAPDRRKLFLLIGGAAAVVVVGLLAFLLLGGSGGEDEGGLVTPAPRSEAPAEAPVAQAPAEKAPADFDGELGRDPFAPIYEPAAPEADAVAVVAGTTGGAAPADASGTTTGTGTPVSVKLLAVTDTGASVTVDGTKYDATVNGETFATSFRLYSVFDQQCAGLLFGDESLVLCKGDVRTLTP
jgi:hypothetical protein